MDDADSTLIAREPEGATSSALGSLIVVSRHHGLNLTIPQIIADNLLKGAQIGAAEIVRCARRAGLKAKAVRLDWRGLTHLRKALPVIVGLKSGASMVLVAVDAGEPSPGVALQDPNADAGVLLNVDRVRFEEAWTGEVILVRRDYGIVDEEQPFSVGLIVGLIFRERRLVRDLSMCAMALSIFALTPIVFVRLMSDKVIYYDSMNTFAVLCLAMGVVIVFEAIFSYLRSFLLLIVTARVDVRLSEYMFDRVLKLPIDYFERTQVGLIGAHMNEIFKIRTFLAGQLFGTILDSMTLAVFLPVMFFFSPVLTAVVLACCGLIVMWLLLMLPTYKKVSGAVIAAEAQRGAFLYQTLAGIRTIKSLALETRQRQQWDVHIAKVAKLKMSEGFVASVIQTGVRPLERLAVSGSYALGVYFAITTKDPVYIGALFAFLMLTQRVAAPLMQMAKLINQYDEARSAVAIVGSLVNQPKEEGSAGHGVRSPLKGQVEFANLRFKYRGATNPALDGVSFEVPIGATLGIVGRSGSGKTTVTRLLQRLHSEYEGLIKIDGVDVREYDVTHLRRSLGVVLQENFLFSGTIRDNITAAKPHATFDEVVRAARLAGAEEFIDRLPRGYETHIYEGSPNLSGGQRQRLAIARALIVDPRILILDEATSALDPDSEAIVNENIRRIARGRTVIVISHRLSSLVNSDAILVLERGKVVDIAKHWELLERCEIYSGLWNQQNRHIAAASRPIAATRGPSLVS
ncbi:MAG: peptidase domain-containing ABC transporter [Roseiarcus sp.]|jgi:ATP-binding cassette subfamily B protein